MKKLFYKRYHLSVLSLAFLISSVSFSTSFAQQLLPAFEAGSYAVGTSNLMFDANDIAHLEDQGDNIIAFWSGRREDGAYVDSLLAYPDDTFRFVVEVPDNSSTYGEQAGKQIPYTGYILYPTSEANDRADYTGLSEYDIVFPRMQAEGEAAIFPDEDKKYPLLIYSHGIHGNPMAELPILQKVASHGYIVMTLFHGDGRFPELIETINGQMQIDLGQFTTRPLAVSTALDILLEDPEFSAKIDTSKIAMAGSSYGGATSFAIAGGDIISPRLLQFDTSLTDVVEDDRVKTIFGIVPFMGNDLTAFFGYQNSGVGNISIPAVAIGASDDEVAPFNRIQGALQAMTNKRFLIRMNGLGHQLSALAYDDVTAWLKVWLDVFVQDDEASRIYFTEGSHYEGAEDDTLFFEGIPTSIEDELLPNATTLAQNYPNPFNPTTVVQYQLAQASTVELTIYNLLGQEVARFTEGFQNAGTHSIRVDASRWSSGMYLYRLKTNNQLITKKMTLIR